MPVPDLTGVMSLGAGSFHTVVSRDDGTVWSWGSNDLGQLGMDMVAPSPVAFSLP
jgi:alpha-tubulin suppressor-like RCC1 family protein